MLKLGKGSMLMHRRMATDSFLLAISSLHHGCDGE